MRRRHHRNLTLFGLFLLLLCGAFCVSSHASHSLEVRGNTSLWWIFQEQYENGIRQAQTGAPAVDTTTGFNMKQARLHLHYRESELPVRFYTQIRFEERVALLDGYFVWESSPLFRLHLGQMKIPTSYEALGSDTGLDFISRTTLATHLTDWSLSRTPYYSAFFGNRSYHRDLGVGVKGRWRPLSYFLMAGNGLGAGLFIGGHESKEFILTNGWGDLFYGGRLDLRLADAFHLGGHYARNRHDNVLFNDAKTVFDLARESWSTDIRVCLPRVSLVALVGAGNVEDDYFYTEARKLEYSGWEIKAMAWLWQERLQLGLRYDSYEREFFGHGNPIDQRNWTLGLNWLPTPRIRVQWNYMRKHTEDALEPDLDDDILFVNFQYSWEWR